jgi:hypothetical protein
MSLGSETRSGFRAISETSSDSGFILVLDPDPAFEAENRSGSNSYPGWVLMTENWEKIPAEKI